VTTAAGRHLVGTPATPSSTTVESTVPAAPQPVPWWALTSSGVLTPLLVTAWVVAGTRQAATYSPVRQTVSVLSGSGATDRWIVTAAYTPWHSRTSSRPSVCVRFLLLLVSG
jgi:hypothetical protein